jgi:Integral membrane protein (DUF2244)
MNGFFRAISAHYVAFNAQIRCIRLPPTRSRFDGPMTVPQVFVLQGLFVSLKMAGLGTAHRTSPELLAHTGRSAGLLLLYMCRVAVVCAFLCIAGVLAHSAILGSGNGGPGVGVACQLETPPVFPNLAGYRLTVLSRSPQGEQKREFSRHWAKVKLRRPRTNLYPSRLVIESHGRALEVGSFLNEDDRRSLAKRLRELVGERQDVDTND